MITLLIKKTTGYKQGYKLLTYFRDHIDDQNIYVKGSNYINITIDIDGVMCSYIIPGDTEL